MNLTGGASVCRLRVRFGCRRDLRSTERKIFGIQSSSMVERAAVNRDVVGSSPTSGAISSQIRTSPRSFPPRNRKRLGSGFASESCKRSAPSRRDNPTSVHSGAIRHIPRRKNQFLMRPGRGSAHPGGGKAGGRRCTGCGRDHQYPARPCRPAACSP